jgi:hypothetical protein
MNAARSNLASSAAKGQPIEIVADDRERASGVIPFLGSIPEVSVRIERLFPGDYEERRSSLLDNGCSTCYT